MTSSSPPTPSSSASEAAEKEWNRCHAPMTGSTNKAGGSNSISIPSCLYTDENPATTIKGCGFKDEATAKRTIVLTSQKGVRYKQYWTIKAMRERAAYHPHPTSGMRDAIRVFDKWLQQTYQPPTSKEERRELQQEWQEYRQLCNSVANSHAYGKVPTGDEIKRARQDIQTGRHCLVEGIRRAQRQNIAVATNTTAIVGQEEIEFPLVAFTALFGGPGLHGYGKHTIHAPPTCKSCVLIEGLNGLKEVLPTPKTSLLFGLSDPQTIQVSHDRHTEKAKVHIHYDDRKKRTTLTTLWSHNNNNSTHKKNDTIHQTVATPQQQLKKSNDEADKKVVPSWTCTTCTLQHIGESKQLFLSCEVCGTSRPHHSKINNNNNNNNNKRKKQCTSKQQLLLRPTTTTKTTKKRHSLMESTSSATSTITKTMLLPTTLFSPTQSLKSKLQQHKQHAKVSCSTERSSSTRPSLATPISSSSSIPTTLSITPPSPLTTPLSATTATTTMSSSSSSSPSPSPSPSSWGSLKAPSERDVRGSGRKRQKAFDLPPPMMEYLVVMDFEWTADNKTKIEPIAEITQFPSILLKLEERKPKLQRSGNKRTLNKHTPPHQEEQKDKEHETQQLPLQSPASPFVHPPDQQVESLLEDLLCTRQLRPSSSTSSTISPPPLSFLKQDAHVVSVFDTYVRPTLNPTLTPFSIELTGITQDQVNTSPTIDLVLKSYMEWLHSQHLVDSKGTPLFHWCFVTWGDCDIGSTLRHECQYKSLEIPACFYKWINLKEVFAKHYQGQEPKGGLRHCVESIAGVKWGEGRAHNGFVDSINTAKIVRHMVQTGFRFTRPTRGLDSKGIPFGSREKQQQEQQQRNE